MDDPPRPSSYALRSQDALIFLSKLVRHVGCDLGELRMSLFPVILWTTAFRAHSPFILSTSVPSVPITITPVRAKPLDSQTSRSWVLPLQVGVRNKTRTKEAQRKLLFGVPDYPEHYKGHYRSSWQILLFLYSNPNRGKLPLESKHGASRKIIGKIMMCCYTSDWPKIFVRTFKHICFPLICHLFCLMLIIYLCSYFLLEGKNGFALLSGSALVWQSSEANYSNVLI